MSLDWSCDFTHASSHNQSFQWCHMSSSSSKQVTTICKYVDSSKLFKFCEKKGPEQENEMFQTAAKTKKRPSKQKQVGLWKWCWSGNSSHHQGFKGDEVNMIYLCSNFLTDLQRTWHFRKNYEHTLWKWPPPPTLFEKSNFCPKIQFWQNIFTSFSYKFFLTIFLVKSNVSTAKKAITTNFSRVYKAKKIDNFLGTSKLNFWTKMKILNSVSLLSPL